MYFDKFYFFFFMYSVTTICKFIRLIVLEYTFIKRDRYNIIIINLITLIKVIILCSRRSNFN